MAATIKVCIIGETDPFIARLLERYAEASGLHAQRAQVGEEVLALAHASQPAVVILDVELPGQMRGWEAARALRVDPMTAHIPIVSCSWLPASEVKTLLGDEVGHLQKPELPYIDFANALRAANIPIEPPVIV